MQCSTPTKWGSCGKCVACQDRRKRSWVLRMILEAEEHDTDSVTFLTLTYDNIHLPLDGQAAKRDLQLWLKRLRKQFELSKQSVRYLAALEKGTQGTMRFHWHVIMYGLRFSEVNRHFIHSTWGNGFIHWKPATEGRMAYVMKYVLKDKCWLMSRRPGIGAKAIDRLNNMIGNLSHEEMLKLRNDNVITAWKSGRPQAKTIPSLRVGGFYYPLHRYIKDHLPDLRMKEIYGPFKK